MSFSPTSKSFSIKKKIGKLYAKLSSKFSHGAKSHDGKLERDLSTETSIYVSEPDLRDTSKGKQEEPIHARISTLSKNIDTSSSVSSTNRSDSTMVLKQSLTEKLYKNSSILASDPCISDSKPMESSSTIRFFSTENSRARLTSIDEIAPVISLDSMNLQFNVIPLAVQPENVERDYIAKRTKSAQSRKSLKSAPSLADMIEDDSWIPQDNSETSFANFDDLSEPIGEPKSTLSKSLGPKELKSLMHSLKLEQKYQSMHESAVNHSKSKKNKKLAWSDETQMERRRTKSDARFEIPSKIVSKLSKTIRTSPKSENSILKDRTTKNSPKSENSQLKETTTIFVQDKTATFVNRMGEQERSTSQINQYQIIREIGSGAYGTVYLCKSELSGQYFALKMISKSRLGKKLRWKVVMQGPNQHDISEELRKEIAVLKKLSRHPNINYLVEVLDNAVDDNIYMIFELCEYGAVMKLSPNRIATPYTEEMARKMLRDVLLGLEYMHYKKIIHRDIKPENLLFAQDFSVVIADFGISHTFENEQASVQDKNASPAFSPPEAFNENSSIPDGRSADVWSLGITLFALVHGRVPFECEDILELSDQIRYDEIKYSPNISSLLVDLMTGMLKKDPADRLTIAEIKVHPWVTLRGSDPMLSTEENCIYEEVTEEEVKTAFRPAVKLATLFMDTLRRRLSTKRRSDGEKFFKSNEEQE